MPGRFALCVLLLTSLAGMSCKGGDACYDSDGGPMALFDPLISEADTDAGTWLAYPFPADHRRTDAGGPSFATFPRSNGGRILRDYLRVLEEDLDGFGLNSAVYVRFDSPIATYSLTAADGFRLYGTDALQLVDISPSSPDYGRFIPVRWEWWDTATPYIPANTLAVAPMWGFPLRESTTYALVVTTAVTDTKAQAVQTPPLLAHLLGDDDGDATCFADTTNPDLLGSLESQFAPLREVWTSKGLDTGAIGVATVFTTQTIRADLATVYEQIQAEAAPALSDDAWVALADDGTYANLETFNWTDSDTAEFYVYEGRLGVPNYQTGYVPYDSDGGLNHTGGTIAPARMEDIRFVLTVPKEPPRNGESCYPIVQYAHGTGGDAYSFVESTGGRLAGRGMAGIGIDQPMHGSRSEGKSFDVNLAAFNLFNIHSARTNFRQAAIDTLVMTRFIRESLAVPAAVSTTGEAICFDTDKQGFFGHSQGGLSGALAASVEAGIQAWVLSGLGGGLAITVMERKDIVNFEEVVRLLLQLDPSEPLSELHPILSMIQTAIDITDPINYGSHWNRDTTASLGASYLMTSGCYDAQTPHRTASAMAIAGGLPLIEPEALEIPEYQYTTLESLEAPVSANLTTGGTGGYLQWCGTYSMESQTNHYVVFRRKEAINATMRFLESALFEEGAVIERNRYANVE